MLHKEVYNAKSLAKHLWKFNTITVARNRDDAYRINRSLYLQFLYSFRNSIDSKLLLF